MTVREYAKSKGVELVGELSRITCKEDGCRWICYRDEVGNEVLKKMKSNVFELHTAEETKKEAEEFERNRKYYF